LSELSQVFQLFELVAQFGGIPQLLQDALAGTTVCALGGGCFAKRSVFVAGTPPGDPGFDLPVAFAHAFAHAFALQKPAAKKPGPAAAVAALAARQPQGEGGGAAAARNEGGVKRSRT
jgi:hypothetical protein